MGADRAVVADAPAQSDGVEAAAGPASLAGDLFLLYTDIEWEDLPQELRFGMDMTCWRRLRDWQEARYSIGCTSCCWLN